MIQFYSIQTNPEDIKTIQVGEDRSTNETITKLLLLA
tara:strand:- start:29 stop:139 length:111 start_codon:yes stop_codon:yes gene_type:complete